MVTGLNLSFILNLPVLLWIYVYKCPEDDYTGPKHVARIKYIKYTISTADRSYIIVISTIGKQKKINLW